MYKVRRNEKQQHQHAKQLNETVTREKAADTRRRKIEHHHRNQEEMWRHVDNMPAANFSDHRECHDEIKQIKTHRDPHGFEGEDCPLAPAYSFQNAYGERHVHWPQHV